jgi:ribosomal-protein-alanine N-acetyltransferase
VRPLRAEDIPQVSRIDREAFPTMLPPADFGREMQNPLAHYIVAEQVDARDELAGFAGFWLMAGEAHIVNLAVREHHQQQGIGELLLLSLIKLAAHNETKMITLEVRASNDVARKLYAKYGFSIRGIRKGYYSDDREDAIIMTVDDIASPDYHRRLKQLETAYNARWGTDA